MHGYVLPLLMEPVAYARLNQQSALDEAEFVDTAVAELLAGGALGGRGGGVHREGSWYPQSMYGPLSVVCNGVGKTSNLLHVNQCLCKQT